MSKRSSGIMLVIALMLVGCAEYSRNYRYETLTGAITIINIGIMAIPTGIRAMGITACGLTGGSFGNLTRHIRVLPRGRR